MSVFDPRLIETLPLLVCTVILLVDRVQKRRASDEDRIQAAHEAFKHGQITFSELERRLEKLVDDRNDKIRRVVEQVSGIGPSRAEQLARHFDSVADLETASVEELQEINDIGPSRAQAIHHYLHGDDPEQVAAPPRNRGEVAV